MRHRLPVLSAGFLFSLPSMALAFTIHVPGDRPTIQLGLEAADEGDTVFVARGTYEECDIILKEGVVLRGELSEHEGVTIDAQERGRVFVAEGLSSATRIEDLTVTGGHATGTGLSRYGGGLLCLNGASPTLRGVAFLDNYASQDGGAVCCQYHSSPALTDCIFSGNEAGNRGGGLHCQDMSSPTITGCLFTGNKAIAGGAMRFSSSCSPTITETTIAGNRSYRAGGLVLAGTSSGDLENVIVWDNCASELGDQIYLADAGSSISFRCCDVDSAGIDGDGAVTWDWGNLFTDPLFCAPEPCGNAPTTAGDYALRSCSPCLDPPTCGLVGALGAGSCPRTWHILPDGSGDAPTIQEGIYAACAGETVLVAPGTYYEHGINLKSGIVLRGETGRVGAAIIDAQSADRVFYCQALDNTTLIEGLTITGGAAGEGGGLWCSASSLIVNSCTFHGNSATMGAGMSCNNGATPTLNDCVFSENTASCAGGLQSLNGSSPVLNNCLFADNTATGILGGGVYCQGAGVTLNGCTFAGNESSSYGGGVAVADATVALTGCLLFGNSSGQGAAFQSYQNSTVTVSACTFYGNTSLMGSGMDLGGSSSAVVENTIVAFSISGSGLSCNDPGSSYTLSCCDIYGNPGGDWIGCIADQYGVDGNISEDPLFCGPAADDFHVDAASPCLDAPGCGLIGAWGQGCDGERTEVAEMGEAHSPVPSGLYLGSAVPNPFNPVTEITYGIPGGAGASPVSLKIHDAGGRLVRTLIDAPRAPGAHRATWDGADERGRPVASGVYFYRLEWNGQSETRRTVLVR